MVMRTRRQLLKSAALGTGVWMTGEWVWADAESSPLAATTRAELAGSSLVYLSPLKSDGNESRCKREIWFSWDGESVAIVTSAQGWKARAVSRGLDQARVWVADYGRIRVGEAQKLARAPSFLARAAIDRDPEAFERLLASFGKKYPGEWSTWETRFRNGIADGTRVVIRYRPLPDTERPAGS